MTTTVAERSRGMPRPLAPTQEVGPGDGAYPGSRGLVVKCKVVAPSHPPKSGFTCGRASKRRFLRRQGLRERIDAVATTLAELEAGSFQVPGASGGREIWGSAGLTNVSAISKNSAPV